MENSKRDIITRRAFILGGLGTLGFTTLLSRLYYLQFVQSAKYATQAENNRIRLQLIAPERGFILDRLGKELATNEKNYQLFFDATQVPRGQFRAALDTLAKHIDLTDKRIAALEQERKSSPILMVREHLSWDELSRVELHRLDLPGCYINIGQSRSYPLKEKAAHLLGYVGPVAEEELTDQPLLRLPNFRIGKSGVEKLFEDSLRGTAGVKELEVDVHGLPVRELSTRQSVPGALLKTTIHAELQQYAAEQMGTESGSVIVMDMTNGDVLTFVSMPAFDPDIFSKEIPHDYWKTLHDNTRDPLVNKAIQGQYPPGSTFKMIVGLAGLKAGSITASTRVNCPGHFYLGNHKFNCWKEGGHGSMDVHSAIQQSCDTFFYTVAQRTGIQPVADMAREFGLGSLTGIGLLSEKGGLIPDPEWKLKRYKQAWQGGDTINAGIGQGYVLATPMQLCLMVARMASGMKVSPRLSAEEELTFEPLDISSAHLDVIRGGMEAVVNSPGGTAYGKKINEPEFAFGGKTGTSQVKKILVRGQNQNSIPWEARHHALFVGFAPISNPKYACCVAIEHGGGGSAAAAPIARDVLLKVQQLMA